MNTFQSGHFRLLLMLMLSCCLLAQEGRGQATLTISSDPTTSGWSYSGGTLTVNSTSTANVNDIIGYLNAGPLTILGATADLSVTVSSAISSIGTANGLTIGADGNTGLLIIDGALTLKGGVTLNGDVLIVTQSISSTAGGDIVLNANSRFDIVVASRVSISTVGGDITINSDVNADGLGMLMLANLTLDAGSGDIIIKGSDFFWDRTRPLPYINGTGSFTLEPSAASFGLPGVMTNLFHLDQDGNGMSALTIGKPSSTSRVLHDYPGGISVTGPIKIYGGDFWNDEPLSATGGATSTIEIYASANVVVFDPITATGDITLEVNGNLDLITNVDLTNLKLKGNAPQDISGTSTITNLTVDKDPGVRADLKGGMLSVTGVLYVPSGDLMVGPNPSTPGYLTMKSSASGTARVASHTTSGRILGNMIVERFIPATVGGLGRQKQWRTLGFPFLSFELSRISGIGISTTSGAESFMTFNEGGDDQKYGNTGSRNAGYSPLTNSTTVHDGFRGVMAWLYGPDNTTPLTGGNLSADLTISSFGEVYESGNDVVLTTPNITNSVKGWNLISNPYASSIDWRQVSAVSPTVASTVYRWDPAAANWTTYNANTDLGFGNGSPYIESGSAFFITAATPGNGVIAITLPQSSKVANTENKHFSKAPFRLDIPGERVPGTSTLAGLRLKASGMGNPIPGEAYLDVSRTDATKGWDPKYDGWMMSRSSGANVYFDGEKDQDFSMQFDAPLKSGEQRYYPLTVTTPQPGETLIDISSEGKWSSSHTVALIDQQAGKTILMKGDTLKYKVRLDELKSEGRFVLAINHVKPNADGSIPGLQLKVLGNPVTGNTIDLLINHPTAAAKRWKVWDMSGREAGSGVFSKDAGIQHRLTVPGIRNPGIYLVQVEMDNGETSQLRIQRN